MPQRQLDIAQAKELMAAAGMANGFTVKLTTEKYLEIPDYAVIIQNAVKPIGIDIQINVETQDAYYGKAVFGQSDWLDSVLGITDYGHRGVPNVLMAAPLKSDGTWNSAHFKNKDYDSLVTPVHRLGRPADPAPDRRQDRDSPARRDPGDLRLFLRLHAGDREAGHRRASDGHGPALPGQRVARVSATRSLRTTLSLLYSSPSPPSLGERAGVRGFNAAEPASRSELILRRPLTPTLSPLSGGEGEEIGGEGE